MLPPQEVRWQRYSCKARARSKASPHSWLISPNRGPRCPDDGAVTSESAPFSVLFSISETLRHGQGRGLLFQPGMLPQQGEEPVALFAHGPAVLWPATVNN